MNLVRRNPWQLANGVDKNPPRGGRKALTALVENSPRLDSNHWKSKKYNVGKQLQTKETRAALRALTRATSIRPHALQAIGSNCSGNGSGIELATEFRRYSKPTMIHLRISVNRNSVASFLKGTDMNDRKVTPEMVPVIKKARLLKIPYSWITGYYPGLNFGRIADVMKGRLFPSIPPADDLPPDFPSAAARAA